MSESERKLAEAIRKNLETPVDERPWPNIYIPSHMQHIGSGFHEDAILKHPEDLEMINEWRNAVYGYQPKPEPVERKVPLIHEVWSPRWKHFRPPMWPIFRWAYHIKREVFTTFYPTRINSTEHIYTTVTKPIADRLEFNIVLDDGKESS